MAYSTDEEMYAMQLCKYIFNCHVRLISVLRIVGWLLLYLQLTRLAAR